MKFKIRETTDGKYCGEIIEATYVAGPGEKLTHKETTFDIIGFKQNNPFITFYCPNYIAVVEILEP